MKALEAVVEPIAISSSHLGGVLEHRPVHPAADHMAGGRAHNLRGAELTLGVLEKITTGIDCRIPALYQSKPALAA